MELLFTCQIVRNNYFYTENHLYYCVPVSNCESSLRCSSIYEAENMLCLDGRIHHSTYCSPLTETASDVIHSSLINKAEVCLCLHSINLSEEDQRWHLEDDLQTALLTAAQIIQHH